MQPATRPGPAPTSLAPASSQAPRTNRPAPAADGSNKSSADTEVVSPAAATGPGTLKEGWAGCLFDQVDPCPWPVTLDLPLHDAQTTGLDTMAASEPAVLQVSDYIIGEARHLSAAHSPAAPQACAPQSR